MNAERAEHLNKVRETTRNRRLRQWAHGVIRDLPPNDTDARLVLMYAGELLDQLQLDINAKRPRG